MSEIIGNMQCLLSNLMLHSNYAKIFNYFVSCRTFSNIAHFLEKVAVRGASSWDRCQLRKYQLGKCHFADVPVGGLTRKL